MAWNLFFLPASTADSTLLPHSQGQMDPHTPPPLLSMASSNTASWPRHGHLVISQTVRRKSRSQWSILQFMNRLTVTKSASKSSAVSAQEGGIVYWPASWVAYKRKSGRLYSSVWSQWSTPPHPSWTQPELHHLDTVCWISFDHGVHLLWISPANKGLGPQHQCIYNFIRSGQELG